MNIRNTAVVVWAITFAMLAFSTGFSEARAQNDFQGQFHDLLGDSVDDGLAEYSLQGDFTVEQGTSTGTLNITLDIKSGWHGYSQKQLSGQSPTVIEVAPSQSYTITGPFVPNKQPTAKTINIGDVEEFEGQVVWSAPIEFAEGFDVESATIDVRVRGQVCSNACVPFQGDSANVTAKFKQYAQSVKSYVSDSGSITGSFDATTLTPDGTGTLTVTAKMAPGWHIYKNEPFKRPDTTPQPTIIYFSRSSGFNVGEPIASSEPIEHELGLPNEKYIYFHDDSVTWTIPVTADEGIEPGTYNLEGKIIFQFCTESNCDYPAALDFKFPVSISNEPVAAPVGVALSVIDGADIEQIEVMMDTSKQFWAEQSAATQTATAIAPNDLAFYLLLAFSAGLILNAMPCVLPVIGLKVMSFVQQAGENRGRILLLNIVFSFGLLSVFWVLATLSAFFGFGWGDWLTKSFSGSIIITSIVFAFGLSMLGVWEIPIPGMSGSSGIGKQASEDGLMGAYLLGILTTILATPCTGPMLVPAVTFTAGQPPWVAYLIFTTIGLGMALPYLLVGIFPSLISWLPRPGAWMTTFKQVTGFILMGTVVFLMSSFSSEPRSEYLVAMMATLLFIAVACWWIGRTSLAAETSEQLRAWGTAMAVIAAGAFLSFTYLGPSPYELDWQEYSSSRLAELSDENELVFIDFTGPG